MFTASKAREIIQKNQQRIEEECILQIEKGIKEQVYKCEYSYHFVSNYNQIPICVFEYFVNLGYKVVEKPYGTKKMYIFSWN